MRSERIATDLCARESTDGDFGDHGDQLETNLRTLEDLSALRGALWRSHRSPPSGMGVLGSYFHKNGSYLYIVPMCALTISSISLLVTKRD